MIMKGWASKNSPENSPVSLSSCTFSGAYWYLTLSQITSLLLWVLI
jgi:hypothetical protein